MDRTVFAIQLASEMEADFKATVDAFQDAFEDFTKSRSELGLKRIEVWVQSTELGPLVIFVVEGEDLATYYTHIRTASGVDEWMRQSLERWALSQRDVEAGYRFPQSEPTFVWSVDS